MAGDSPAAPGSTLIGRQLEYQQLQGALRAALGGRGGCVLVAGEAGIGKSRLLDELAGLGRALGAHPLWGRCWESGGAPPFWPWTQLLRAAIEAFPDAAPHLGAARTLLDPAEARQSAGGDRDQFLLFDCVARFLRESSAGGTLLLLFDDIHAADPDSLALLRFLVSGVAESHLCVCAAFRPADAAGRPVDDLGREALRISLHGLTEPETGALARRMVAEMDVAVDVGAIPARFFDTLYRATGGNPFFVRETVREIVLDGAAFAIPASPDLLPVPEQVRQLVRAQLRPLSAETLRLLRVAAVAGREFDVRVVRAVLAEEQPGCDPLPLLDEARRRGLLGAVSGGAPRIAFAHALIRETLYDDCPSAERARWHGQIATAIEAVVPAALSEHIAEVAHHRLRAGAASDTAQAVRAAVMAAKRSEAVLAYGEAGVYWQGALELAESACTNRRRTGADERQRCELMIGLGSALNLAGDRERARTVLEGAMEAARGCGDAEGFARAVLAYGGETLGTMEVAKVNAGPGAVFDDRLARLLREALAQLGDGESALHARLLSRLAVDLYFTAPMDERAALIERALAIARQAGDAVTLGHVLCEALVAVWGPESGADRLQWSREAIRLGQRTTHVTLEAAGRVFTVNTLLELGDTHALRAEAPAMMRLAERHPLPLLRWQVLIYRGMRALLEGRHDDAEQLANEGLQLGRHDNAALAWTVQMMELRRQQGRLAELGESIGLFKAVADQYPSMPYIRASLAHLLVELGDRDEAGRQVEIAAVDGFATLTRDITWLPALTRLAEVCVALHDPDRAASLYAHLTPFAEQFSLGTYGSVCWGSVARDLANLAALLQRWDDSERWFAMAVQRNAALDATWWVAQTQLDHAAMLCRRSEVGAAPADAAERARRCVVAAAELAERVGASPLAERVAQLAARTAALDAAPAAVAPGPSAADRAQAAPVGSDVGFVCEGEYWAIGYDGDTVRMKDSRGLRFIAALVAHAGREIHALELLRLAAGAGEAEPRQDGSAAELATTRDGGDAGALIDPQAKAEYGRRVTELRAELDEAQAQHDHGRAALLQEELDAVAGELRRAIGLGGRVRRAASSAERARVNVTRAVAAALQRVAAVHPDLARHLRHEIRTGMFCSYRGPHGRRRGEP